MISGRLLPILAALIALPAIQACQTAAPTPKATPTPPPRRDPQIAPIMSNIDQSWKIVKSYSTSGARPFGVEKQTSSILDRLTDLSGTNRALTSPEFGERIVAAREAVQFLGVVARTRMASESIDSQAEFGRAIAGVDRACNSCHSQFRNF